MKKKIDFFANKLGIALILSVFLLSLDIAQAQAPVDRPKRPTTSQPSKPQNPKPQANQPSRQNGKIAGHDYVDLGLSVKWATCNVGANTPSSYGYAYAWGETSPKSSYTESNSKWYKVTFSELQSRNAIDGQGNLCPQYDVARQSWGAPWRMPTKSEIEELLNKCKWTWTTMDGVNGYKVEGTNGKSIFLPAAGYLFGSDVNYVGSNGNYWSATALSDSSYSYYLYFNSSVHYWVNYSRYCGRSVRPVAE